MNATEKTRTQRRMEKRQAIILLVLVLFVALASFTLGVIVGRRGAERDLAQQQCSAEKVLVTQLPAPLVLPSTTAAGEKVDQDTEDLSQDAKLSFYDDLAKETAPLGSGINLAPAPPVEVPVVVVPPIDLPDQPIVKTVSPVAVAPTVKSKPVVAVVEDSPVEFPQAISGGSHAVQVGSFGSAVDAIALKKRLLQKNYPAFMVEADLGKKGLWYRVRVGPYADAAAAKLVQQLLAKKEQLKGFISRQ